MDLVLKIKQLDTNIGNPTEETQIELQLNEIIKKYTQFLIYWLRQEAFHHSNKSGKYLANQIRRNKEKATISIQENSAGKPSSSSEEINQIFYNFYSKLYS